MNNNFSIEVMIERFEIWKWQLFGKNSLHPFFGLIQTVFNETVSRDL